MILKERFLLLREKMQKLSLDYYYLPSTDPHASEYLPPCWQRSAWFSNFTGSVGNILIGLDTAYLWTDGRYFLQAQQQLDPLYFCIMGADPETATFSLWLAKQKRPLRIGLDPKLISIEQATAVENTLEKLGGELVYGEENLIDSLWKTQPTLPVTPITVLSDQYTGCHSLTKIQQVRSHLQELQATACVINTLDQIAWLLNIRGNDIPYNPLVISYLLITQEKIIFFVSDKKCTEPFLRYCLEKKISVQPYEALAINLSPLSGCVLLDPHTATPWMRAQLTSANVLLKPSIVPKLRASKNNVEQQGMYTAHQKDGLALIRFLHWLEQSVPHSVITEWSAAQKLSQFRAQLPGFRGESFNTISAFAHHGAIVHYAPPREGSLLIDNSALYLLDSGGQYWEGTTDVTRTIHLGQPTPAEKKHYTLVLKAHIALRTTLFPAGATGAQLDGITRSILWEHELDYLHGTGHGVGSYLCVHESPPSISSRSLQSPFTAGMVVSNEPGLYFAGQYGIRIENLCITQKSKHSDFLCFKDLTLVPYARNLIEITLLTQKEKAHIDDYHQAIYATFDDQLSPTERDWLQKCTAPLQ